MGPGLYCGKYWNKSVTRLLQMRWWWLRLGWLWRWREVHRFVTYFIVIKENEYKLKNIFLISSLLWNGRKLQRKSDCFLYMLSSGGENICRFDPHTTLGWLRFLLRFVSCIRKASHLYLVLNVVYVNFI